jgi:diaminopimelate decarboxylase
VPLDGRASRRYVSVDGGMSDNIRTALYDACTTAGSCPAVPSATAPASRRCAGSSASTARAATSWCATAGCPPTWRPATCSRSPPPAPTATRWPARTTGCRGPAVVAVRDGERAVLLRRETPRTSSAGGRP